MGEWIHGFFDAAYVRHLRAQWSDALTRKQVAFVVKALGLRRGARVLDVPCGFGRHARLLARRGMRVVGVDLSPAMITEARRGDPEPRLTFRQGDMRRILIDHRDRDRDARLPGGRRSVRPIQHYVYTLPQWKHMFRATGLRLTAAWSDYGQPYRRGQGPRLLVAGVRLPAPVRSPSAPACDIDRLLEHT